MKIYSMTATFGKLEHETLTLKPGMNVIQAPNEWGKSTWCAFLLAMLYGLDTRAKSTRNALADKDHFAPWSGSLMSGRMDLHWNGRDITIERTTRGRIPMGTFRAFETKTGLDVPELDANNCGQVLLGVEQSVFRRAGFIRLSDLPVTQDDALRRRLNALVTTGDESGDASRLEKGLRELKNRCRHNHTGLLPQLEQQRVAAQATLQELDGLSSQLETLEIRLSENAEMQRSLENHIAALAWQDAQSDARRMAEAEAMLEAARDNRDAWHDHCALLPTKASASARMEALQRHREALNAFREDQQMGTPLPHMPRVPRPFLGMDPTEAMEQVDEDLDALRVVSGPVWWLLLAMSFLLLAACAGFAWMEWFPAAAASGSLGILLLLLAILRRQGQAKGRKALYRKYGTLDTENWVELARQYAEETAEYRRAELRARTEEAEMEERRAELEVRHADLCGEETVDSAMEDCRQILVSWDALADAQEEYRRAQEQWDLLRSLIRTAPAPTEPDSLDCTGEEALRRLQDARLEQQTLLNRRGEYRGRMEALGAPEAYREKLAALEVQIASLEKTYAALELAQQTLTKASAELQRRFAPRITKRAQTMLSQLTQGRYDRLILGSDLSLSAGAKQEDTLHDAQWRSEGTIDQLYLTLRLAVAEELTPSAPLILDDALIRFDEHRMAAALEILKDLSKTRQIILFTCQQREKDYLEKR